jgi:macrolide transport system ATP-binding/permease protein
MSAAALQAFDVTKIYGGRRVLDGVTLTAAPGQRLGLIGENGAGKSTLLRVLAGREEADAGHVSGPPDLGFLEQEPALPATTTVQDVVDSALAEAQAGLRRLDELAGLLSARPAQPAVLAAYGQALSWAEHHQAWDADRRAELVLAGLGLAALVPERPLGTLSGGQRRRLELAALLVRRPAAVLLDEPTNHLDDQAVEFLQAHLRQLPGVVVVASHDRVFLDEVCTEVCDLDPSRAGLVRYGGAYSGYLAEKRAERLRWEQAWARRQDELAALRLSVAVTARRVAPGRPMRDRNKPAYDQHGARVQAAVSSRVRNARQRLAELLADPVPKPPAPLRFAGGALTAAGTETGGPVLSARDVVVPGRLVLDRLDLPAGGRLLVTGPNGAGKSTLLAILAGRLRPACGTVSARPGVRVGLLQQDATFAGARPSDSPETIYRAVLGDGVVPLAQLGLLAPAECGRPVVELSAGQRRRLALALLVAAAPEVLLLDEPANHLSLTLVSELEEALRAAPGAVVVATHDRWQRRHWDGDRLALSPAGSLAGCHRQRVPRLG